MKQKTHNDFVTETYLEIKLDELDLKIDDKSKLYRDQILTKLDEVMGELQNIREDNMLDTHQIRELRKDVDDHEKKIKTLQQTAA